MVRDRVWDRVSVTDEARWVIQNAPLNFTFIDYVNWLFSFLKKTNMEVQFTKEVQWPLVSKMYIYIKFMVTTNGESGRSFTVLELWIAGFILFLKVSSKTIDCESGFGAHPFLTLETLCVLKDKRSRDLYFIKFLTQLKLRKIKHERETCGMNTKRDSGSRQGLSN